MRNITTQRKLQFGWDCPVFTTQMFVEKSLELLPCVHLGHGVSPGLPSKDDNNVVETMQGSLAPGKVRGLNVVPRVWVADDLGLLLPMGL